MCLWPWEQPAPSPEASFTSGEEFCDGRATVITPFPRLAGSFLLSHGSLLQFLGLFKENRKAPLSWFPFLFFYFFWKPTIISSWTGVL